MRKARMMLSGIGIAACQPEAFIIHEIQIYREYCFINSNFSATILFNYREHTTHYTCDADEASFHNPKHLKYIGGII